MLAGPDVNQPVTMIQPVMSRVAAMPIRATRPAARERPHMPIPMVTSMTPTARNGGSRANAEAPRAMKATAPAPTRARIAPAMMCIRAIIAYSGSTCAIAPR